MLFVNEVITVANIGPFMFICRDPSCFMNRVFFWNVDSASASRRSKLSDAFCTIDHDQRTALSSLTPRKQKDQTVVASY